MSACSRCFLLHVWMDVVYFQKTHKKKERNGAAPTLFECTGSFAEQCRYHVRERASVVKLSMCEQLLMSVKIWM